jgi:hypothetical protein
MQPIKKESDKPTRTMLNGQLHHHLGSHWKGSMPTERLSQQVESVRMDMWRRGHLKAIPKMELAM